jgi:hypothetical protein
LQFQGQVTNRHAFFQADDELDKPYLAGFEWDKEESWTRLIVHTQANAGQSMTSSKKKKKGGDE